MRQSLTVVPIVLLGALFLLAPPAAAGSQPGDRNFSINLGYTDTRSDNSYQQDHAVILTYEHQKSGYAAYRGTAGFLTIEGREPVSPGAGMRDADSLYVAADFVVAPRFKLLNPYLMAGLGLYSVRFTDNLDSSHSLEVGGNWGLGLDVQILRSFAVRGEIAYHYVTGDLASPIRTLTIGGRFTFD